MFKIIFIVGGPGVGKGTQGSLLVNKYPSQFYHISLGDVLRAEQEKPNSEWGELLRKNLREGLIGPKQMVVGILEDVLNEMTDEDKKKTILIDGRIHPRRGYR